MKLRTPCDKPLDRLRMRSSITEFDGNRMETELQLRLFGTVEIDQNGQPVTAFKTKKAQALLCYLAVTGQPHTRSVLAGLLWENLPEAKARMNLSKTLTYLRRAVGAHLKITPQTVAFNREAPYQLDVETFSRHLSHRSAAPSLEQLREAVDLYRGDFLEEFYVRDALAFEEWALIQRARLRELALQALHTLVAHYIQQGEAGGYRIGIDYATRLLALEPWREEAHRQLMRLLALSGQRGAALAQFETCRRLLAEELGVEPGQEMRTLYEGIRTGAFTKTSVEKLDRKDREAKGREPDSPPAAVERPPPEPVPLPSFLASSPAQPGASIPLVAREYELAQLDRFLDLALTGRGGIVFITGAAGQGKTALAEAFARQAQQSHAHLIVASGRCNAYGGLGDPYLPFREILEMLTGEIETRWAAGAIDQEQAKRLWRLLPHTVQLLLEIGPDLIDIFVSGPALLAHAAAAVPPETAWLSQLQRLVSRKAAEQAPATLTQNALFTQYTRLLQRLASQNPLLLLLDDLQWADTGSISLLFHLGQRLAGQPILIVGIYRPDEIVLGWHGERHPLEPVINEFQHDLGPIHIDLGQTAGRPFVDALIDSQPNRLDEAFRQALYHQTAGHALFTVEMLRGLQERGDLTKDGQGRWIVGPCLNWDILPARVEGAIKERIDRLPLDFQESLQIASVEGETFTAEVVAQVQGQAARQVVRQLGELDRSQRLVQNQGSRRVAANEQRLSLYRFRHILFQTYLYHSLDQNERAYLHEAVGEALEALTGEQVEPLAGQLARHFQEAGIPQKAIYYLQLAGQQALRSYANHEALIFFNEALALLKTRLETPDRVQQELALQLATIPPLITTQGYAASAVGQASAHARRLCPADKASPELFYALRGLWVFHFVRAEIRQAHEFSQQLLAVAQALSDSALRLDAHHVQAGTFSILGEFVEAREHFEQAIALYQPQQHQIQVSFFGLDLGVSCYAWIAHPLYHMGYPDQARHASQKALQMAERLDHPFSLGLGLAYTAMLQQFCQNVSATQMLAERAIAVCQEHGFVYYLAWAKILLGWAQAQQAPGEEAIQQMRQALSDLLATEAGLREPYYLGLLAQVYGQTGQIERGLTTLAEALAKATEQKNSWYGAELHRLYGELLQQKREDDAAVEAYFQRAIKVARQQQGKAQELRATLSLARLWQKQGRIEMARQQLAKIYNWFNEGFDIPDLKQAGALLKELE